MLKTMKRIIRRRKGVSPVFSAILLIALTVSSVSIVYFVIIPFLNTTSLSASIFNIKDTNKDSRYDEITIFFSNTGTKEVEIIDVIVWTTPLSSIGNPSSWISHEDWNFTRAAGNIVYPSNFREERLQSDNQIELSLDEELYYRLELYSIGKEGAYFSDWKTLSDQVDFSDMISDYENFELLLDGLDGSIDVPGWDTNNYETIGGPVYGPLYAGQYIYLPVVNETNYIKFFYTGKLVVFHSNNGNLSSQPTQQVISRENNPFRARRLFVLGLAGSWGDEFPNSAWALRLTITYTDNTNTSWDLGHDYIDDWWYNSNSPRRCNCDHDIITEIDLGLQIDDPNGNQPYGEHIHTHTAGFYLNFYKYVKFITFTDPGNDASGPHLLSITAG